MASSPRATSSGRAIGFLEAAGLHVTIFDRGARKPHHARRGSLPRSRARRAPDLIIGLGGGSSMDTAKGCNFILTNGGQMQDYWGVGKATKPMLPLIAIPTTAGTGSECQSFALIADEKTHQKMACGDPKARRAVAILDPAAHGLAAARASRHAPASTRSRTPWKPPSPRSATRSPRSTRARPSGCAAPDLERVFRDPHDLEARAAMQLGAAYAGTAIENSMLGAAHCAANPLTAHFGVVHGQAVGVMLPHVVRFNAQQPEAAAIYAELAKFAGLVDWSDRDGAGCRGVDRAARVPAPAPVKCSVHCRR